MTFSSFFLESIVYNEVVAEELYVELQYFMFKFTDILTYVSLHENTRNVLKEGLLPVLSFFFSGYC